MVAALGENWGSCLALRILRRMKAGAIQAFQSKKKEGQIQ
jgi:hypothetical protein